MFSSVQPFHPGDRVKHTFYQRKGTVMGDIFWGPGDHRYHVVYDDGVIKEEPRISLELVHDTDRQ